MTGTARYDIYANAIGDQTNLKTHLPLDAEEKGIVVALKVKK